MTPDTITTGDGRTIPPPTEADHEIDCEIMARDYEIVTNQKHAEHSEAAATYIPLVGEHGSRPQYHTRGFCELAGATPVPLKSEAMKVMYAIRLNKTVIRVSSEKEAREWVARTKEQGRTAKYLGKVKVSDGNLSVTNADPKKRGSKRKRQ